MTTIFYMLYVEGGVALSARHKSYEIAAAEAEKILRADAKLKKVFILQAIETIELADQPIKRTQLNNPNAA
jgi:hypothetical protein